MLLARLLRPLSAHPKAAFVSGIGIAAITAAASIQSQRMGTSSSSLNMDPASLSRGKSDSEWRAQLSREQFHILREKGTEMPGTGKYNHHKAKGVYECAGCGTPLYTSEHKFDSGCGWPAYFDAIPGAVTRHEDRAMGMVRTEITCSACGGHLGHVFKGEGYDNPTDERHCVNSVSLKFSDGDSAQANGKM